MELALIIVYCVCVIISFVCWLYLIVAAFRERVLYGLICLFCCSLGALIYGIMRFSALKKPVIAYLLCITVMVAIHFSSAGPALEKFFDKHGIHQSESTPLFQNPETKVFVPPDPAPVPAPATGESYPARQITRATEVRDKVESLNKDTGAMITPGNTPVKVENPQSSAEFEDAPASPAGVSRTRPSSGSGHSTTVVVTGDMDADWQAASELLKVKGVMKNANVMVATVNGMAVKLNNEVPVELNGQVYPFKIVKIDVNKNEVEFVPARR